MTYQAGQIHQLVIEPRCLVRLVEQDRTGTGPIYWLIEDVLTEQRKYVEEWKLYSKSYNEMEVLAWASK